MDTSTLQDRAQRVLQQFAPATPPASPAVAAVVPPSPAPALPAPEATPPDSPVTHTPEELRLEAMLMAVVSSIRALPVDQAQEMSKRWLVDLCLDQPLVRPHTQTGLPPAEAPATVERGPKATADSPAAVDDPVLVDPPPPEAASIADQPLGPAGDAHASDHSTAGADAAPAVLLTDAGLTAPIPDFPPGAALDALHEQNRRLTEQLADRDDEIRLLLGAQKTLTAEIIDAIRASQTNESVAARLDRIDALLEGMSASTAPGALPLPDGLRHLPDRVALFATALDDLAAQQMRAAEAATSTDARLLEIATNQQSVTTALEEISGRLTALAEPPATPEHESGATPPATAQALTDALSALLSPINDQLATLTAQIEASTDPSPDTDPLAPVLQAIADIRTQVANFTTTMDEKFSDFEAWTREYLNRVMEAEGDFAPDGQGASSAYDGRALPAGDPGTTPEPDSLSPFELDGPTIDSAPRRAPSPPPVRAVEPEALDPEERLLLAGASHDDADRIPDAAVPSQAPAAPRPADRAAPAAEAIDAAKIRRTRILGAAALALIITAAGTFGYLKFFSDDAPPPVIARTAPPEAPAARAATPRSAPEPQSQPGGAFTPPGGPLSAPPPAPAAAVAPPAAAAPAGISAALPLAPVAGQESYDKCPVFQREVMQAQIDEELVGVITSRFKISRERFFADNPGLRIPTRDVRKIAVRDCTGP